VGAAKKNADVAAAVFADAVKIAVFAENFGGRRFMSRKMVAFIRNWEVERYRSKVSQAAAGGRRLAGKIAVITGGAQGFGYGIAVEMCGEGASVVIADMNEEGAKKAAAELCGRFGPDAAFAVAANVSDEASVENMCREAVLRYGGLDVFVSNAGILRSGGLEDMDYKTFDLMTKVNYEAYFLCVKYASRYMKLQHAYDRERYFDVIQVNSKSGLEGSNRNFAYAGGKFGGIGLTQSFALELVGDHVKVNAVCPGNYFGGPLWSDPEKGLFIQYLNAGKVPGAKTVADVREYYLSKVPMRKGCNPEDVCKAILYAIDQTGETGQAIPVTGGQVMLS
jgi:NAD(P)-dependent dehydrogenase (short-subunit alcohol dehydrogenase family)